MSEVNLDPAEIEKFDALASRWWDPDGDFKPLHDINDTRVNFIRERTDLEGGPLVDVGCGGGILTEAFVRLGVTTTGMDMASKALGVARLHAAEAGLDIDYRETTAEALASALPGHFRTVACLEMLEHVADYPSTIRACADMAMPGADLFFSTINRTPAAYALLILGAEYVMNILPRGTHEYEKFIRPAELCRAIEAAGLEVKEISGMSYNPFSRRCAMTRNVSANYILHARKPASATAAGIGDHGGEAEKHAT